MWPQLWSWRELNWYNVDFNNTDMNLVLFGIEHWKQQKSDFWNQILQAFAILISWNPQMQPKGIFFQTKPHFILISFFNASIYDFFLKICLYFASSYQIQTKSYTRVACLWSKMPMFQRAGIRGWGLPLLPAFQYLIMTWWACDEFGWDIFTGFSLVQTAERSRAGVWEWCSSPIVPRSNPFAVYVKESLSSSTKITECYGL